MFYTLRKDNKQYNSVFGSDLYSLTLYLKATEICRRVAEFLDQKNLEPIHRRNINFYLCMYVPCAATNSAYAIPKRIQQIDVSKLSDELVEDCFGRVLKKYQTVTDKFESEEGEKDYDSAAKGPHLLKALQTELKHRFHSKRT